MQHISLSQSIFHIPHSSPIIPNNSFYTNDQLMQSEMNLLTDWATERIYAVPGGDTVTAHFNRVFCDVERLPDTEEPMHAKGMGIYYTHTDNGELLRTENENHKKRIIENLYTPHHKKLTDAVNNKLKSGESAIIFDCHSFSSTPLKRELQQDLDRPDICLGTDNYHTPSWLITRLTSHFKTHGFTVALNKPYIGTIVPLSYYRKEKQVSSIMVEINKKLYMNENTYQVNEDQVQKLNEIIRMLFDSSTSL